MLLSHCYGLNDILLENYVIFKTYRRRWLILDIIGYKLKFKRKRKYVQQKNKRVKLPRSIKKFKELEKLYKKTESNISIDFKEYEKKEFDLVLYSDNDILINRPFNVREQ